MDAHTPLHSGVDPTAADVPSVAVASPLRRHSVVVILVVGVHRGAGLGGRGQTLDLVLGGDLIGGDGRQERGLCRGEKGARRGARERSGHGKEERRRGGMHPAVGPRVIRVWREGGREDAPDPHRPTCVIASTDGVLRLFLTGETSSARLTPPATSNRTETSRTGRLGRTQPPPVASASAADPPPDRSPPPPPTPSSGNSSETSGAFPHSPSLESTARLSPAVEVGWPSAPDDGAEDEAGAGHAAGSGRTLRWIRTIGSSPLRVCGSVRGIRQPCCCCFTGCSQPGTSTGSWDLLLSPFVVQMH